MKFVKTAAALLSLSTCLLSACDRGGEDSAAQDSLPSLPDTPERGPDPWLDLASQDLSPLRSLLTRTIDGEQAASRVFQDPETQLSFLLDSEAGRVHVLDARYHHSPQARCLPTDHFTSLDHSDREGDCEPDQVELRRGVLETPVSPVALCLDDEAGMVRILDRKGVLYGANMRWLEGNPFDVLRLGEPLELTELGELGSAQMLCLDEEVLIGEGSTLHRYSVLSGEPSSEPISLQGELEDLLWWSERLWILTEEGLFQDDLSYDVIGKRLAVQDERLHISDPEGDQIWTLQGDSLSSLSVDGLLAAMTADEETGRLYAATVQGVAVVEQGAQTALHELGAMADLWMTPSHELLALSAEGELTVLLDETALQGPPPLHAQVLTFFEKPRSPDEDLPCRDASQSVHENLLRARRNRLFLDDLPAPVGLAVTPHAARRIQECEEEEIFATLWEVERTDLGVLFHHESETCGEDQACHEDFISGELGAIERLGWESNWFSGVTPHIDQGMDWAQVLPAVGGPLRLPFFSASVLPEIPHHTDPRGKEPFPVSSERRTRAWTISSAWDVLGEKSSGEVALYPGDSVAAFTQGGCPNVMIHECHLMDLGGGQQLDEQDTEILSLLLHRALASRGEEGVHTWSLHLPDIGAFEFVEACEEEGRLWSGEGCEAAVFQGWMMETWQRYQLNGLLEWVTPSELDWPEP